jgi:signal transduction histidine kinase/ActR/RegA family two-component response regulator
MTTASPVRSSRARAIARAAAIYALLGGAVTLAGWALDIPRLTGWFGSGITMKVNTAIAALLGGTALLLLTLDNGPRRVAQGLAIVVLAIGALTLLEHISGWNLGIDTLLFTEPPDAVATISPQRMGPPAATCYTLLGMALLMVTGSPRQRRVASVLGTAVVTITTLSLVGYLYGIRTLYGIATLTGIALQTATMLAALGIGVLAVLPEQGLAAELGRDDAGGIMFRRLMPAMILFSLVLGWIRVTGEYIGFYDSAFGTAMRTIIEIVVFVALLWWTATDISRHATAARVAHQTLVDADRRKDEFLATLAHELRNPLAPIRTGLQVIRAAGHDSEQAEQALTIMERQLAQMVHLVDDLLDLSRVTRGLIELRTEPVTLSSVLQRAIETSTPHIQSRSHALNVRQPRDEIYVNADTTRLAQAFTNLLNNAAKYTAPRGKITLKVERSGDEAVVQVIDSGAGISAHRLPTIFDIFRQPENDPAGQPVREGLGIGLTLVKRLVEMHGGSVGAESPGLGRGSTFIVRLPIVAAATTGEVPVARRQTTPVRRQRRILVVDDNRDAADSLATLLRLDGHAVHTAGTGTSGLEMADHVRPDIVFLDIGLPDLSGHEVAYAIRKQEWGKDLLLVALRGFGRDPDRTKSLEAGFDVHLVKPVDYADVSRLLAEEPTGSDAHR